MTQETRQQALEFAVQMCRDVRIGSDEVIANARTLDEFLTGQDVAKDAVAAVKAERAEHATGAVVTNDWFRAAFNPYVTDPEQRKLGTWRPSYEQAYRDGVSGITARANGASMGSAFVVKKITVPA